MADDIDEVVDGLVLLSPAANAAAMRDLGDVSRFVYDWPEERYHTDRHRLSGSVLEMVVPGRGDPRELGLWKAGKRGRPSTPEQALGSFVHCGLLETIHLKPGERRQLLLRRFAFAPSRADLGDTEPGAEWKTPDRRTTAGKAAWAKFEAEIRGRTPILPEQQRTAERMFRAVAAHPDALALLHPEGLRSEVTGLWRDRRSGRLMRCRFDGLREAEDVIVEIKTDQDPDPDPPRNAYRWLGWGYHRKAALYSDAYLEITGRRPSFCFIFIENDASDERFPPRVSVQRIRFDDPVIALGRDGDGDEVFGYQQAIDLVETYERRGDYHAPWEREAVPFRLPAAVEKRMQFRTEMGANAHDIKSRLRGVEIATP
jgi:hypothetical protein